jgi:hypothetical protein
MKHSKTYWRAVKALSAVNLVMVWMILWGLLLLGLQSV